MRWFHLTVASMLIAAPVHAKPIERLLRDLRHVERGREAVEALVEHQQAAVPGLIRVLNRGGNLTSRGRAVLALSRIGGPEATKALEDVSGPPLLMSWAKAARIRMAPDMKALIALNGLAQSQPELQRPFQRRAQELADSWKDTPLDQLLSLATRQKMFQKVLTPHIVAAGPGPLVQVMVTNGDDTVRRQAAAYLGTIARGDDAAKVAQLVIDAYAFDPKAKDVPWLGGALFLPALSWDRAEAKRLVGELITWHLWCDLHGKKNYQRQIHNNLRSLALARAAGYSSPGWREADTKRWLQIWGGVIGRADLEKMLTDQGAVERYKDVLDAL